MGSGNKITAGTTDSFGFGFNISKFPFQVTLNIQFAIWFVSIGFGKGYDQ
jgi:uncharacterized membrane-anchored protein